MPSKTYTEEFKRDAVALYENSSGASLTTIATDLGINRATLHNWVKRYGTATRTTIITPDSSSSASVTDTERIRQLERQVKRLQE
ncbi:transposase, partial [Corynebacterium casei]